MQLSQTQQSVAPVAKHQGWSDPKPVSTSVHHFSDEEIDLFELFQSLLDHRWWLVVPAALCGLTALIYLLFATPVYQTRAMLQQATPEQLTALNLPGVDYHLSPADAESKVVALLSSQNFRLNYWKVHRALFDDALAKQNSSQIGLQLAQFDRHNLSLYLPQLNKEKSKVADTFLRLSLEYNGGVQGAALLRGLIQQALITANQDVKSSWYSSLMQQLNGLSYQLRIKRTDYRNHLVVKQARLNKAAKIAKQMGIVRPTTLGDFGAVGQGSARQVVRMEVNQKQLPLYFMGSQALTAELSAINAILMPMQDSEADLGTTEDLPGDRFISGVSSLKTKIHYLKQLQPDFDRISLVRIVQSPLAPANPLKPKKMLVLAVGLLLGLMLGVALALLRAAWVKRRDISA